MKKIVLSLSIAILFPLILPRAYGQQEGKTSQSVDQPVSKSNTAKTLKAAKERVARATLAVQEAKHALALTASATEEANKQNQFLYDRGQLSYEDYWSGRRSFVKQNGDAEIAEAEAELEKVLADQNEVEVRKALNGKFQANK